MKRGVLLSLILALILIVSVSALDVAVDSANSDQATIYFSGLVHLDVVFDNIQVVVETNSITDRFIADYSLEVRGDEIYLTADLSDVFQDYTVEEVDSIVISGELDGDDFAKRVAIREGSNVKFGAPNQVTKKAAVVYWIIAIVLILVLFGLLVHLVQSSKHRSKKPVARVSSRKKTKKKAKKKAKKKSSTKKVTKRKSSKKKAKKKSAKKKAKKKIRKR